MAIFAHIVGVDMCRRFSCGRCSIVARHAASRHIGMAECRRAPRGGRMTGPAFRRCCQVRCGLAAGLASIVAAGTRPDHVIMVHRLGGRPSAGDVTIFAAIGRRNMGRTLASCRRAIVTGRTGP